MKAFFARHKVLKVFIIILIALLVFALSMGGTYFALTAGKVKEVQIPNVVNKNLEQAEEEVSKLNLKLEVVEEKYDLNVPEGQIIEQDPKFQNNFKIKEGGTIKVVVSKGQKIVTVPKVTGMKKDEAIQSLKDAGLEATVQEDFNDEVESGYVVKQDVAENEQVAEGTTVTIHVSAGIEQISVPDLSNKKEEDAKKIISDSKLKYKATVKTSDPGRPNGVVVDQNISSGSMVNKGTEITITVNEFNELKSATVTVNVKSLLGYQPPVANTNTEGNTTAGQVEEVALKVTVNGETIEGNRIVKKTATKETFTFQDSGTVEIKVFIDEARVSTKTLNLNEKTSLTID